MLPRWRYHGNRIKAVGRRLIAVAEAWQPHRGAWSDRQEVLSK
jgi:hypothetical protein